MKRMVFLLLAVLGAFSSIVGAQEFAPSFSASLKSGALFTPGAWTAIRLDFVNNSDKAIDGYVQLPINYAGAPVELKQRFLVPGHARVRGTMWAYFNDIVQPVTKKGKAAAGVPELGTAVWFANNGTQVSRCPILGQSVFQSPARGGNDTPSATGAGMVLACSGRQDFPPAAEAQSFSDQLSKHMDYTAAISEREAEVFPRHIAEYEPFRVVILDRVDPNRLDARQRAMLLQHVRAGAQLILPSPTPEMHLEESWLSQFMPVHLVGQRKMKQVAGKGSLPIPLTGWEDCAEATAGEGKVVLADENYVYAAWKPLGLGRVIFVSFPVNAVNMALPAGKQLWQSLLGTTYRPLEINQEAISSAQEPILRSIVGLQTPAWKWAAGMAGGYLLAVALVQLLWRGARRPRAFAVLAILGVLVTTGIVLSSVFARSAQLLMAAGTGLIDLSDDGGMQVQYQVMFGQNQPGLALASSGPSVAFRPIQSTPELRPTLEQGPWVAPNAGAAEQRIDRVWQATGPAPAGLAANVALRFGPDGAVLHTQHNASQPLDGAVLLFGDEIVRVPAMPPGQSDSALPDTALNAPGDFTNSTLIASDASRTRSAFITTLYPPTLTRQTDRTPQDHPQLLAWLNAADAGSLLHSSIPAGNDRRQNLLRLPVSIEPTAPGTQVKVDPGFTVLTAGVDAVAGHMQPLSAVRASWSENSQPGSWLIGIRPPPTIGKVQPEHFSIDLEMNAPLYTITLRRGQCSAGKVRPNPAGPVVAEYKNTFGRQQTGQIACSADDIDVNGTVWVSVGVVLTAANTPSDMPSRWSIRRFRAGLDGTVANRN